MKNKLFVLCGKSCTGKDTIMSILLEKINQQNIPIKKLPSCTTRPKRKNEIDGVEYNFKTILDFDKSYKQGEIAEYNTYRIDNINDTWVYYTLKSDINLENGSMLKVVNPVGLAQLRQQYKDNIVVFYISCDDEIRRQRYLNRGALVDSIDGRFRRDNEDFEYIKYDYLIENDGTYSAENRADLILELMKGEMDIE